MISAQAEKYREAYGGESDYAQGKRQDLFTRMGNTVLKEIREYDKNERRNIRGSQMTPDRNTFPDGKKEKNEQQHFRRTQGHQLAAAVSRLKRGLKSEWEKSRLRREHEQLIEQSLE